MINSEESFMNEKRKSEGFDVSLRVEGKIKRRKSERENEQFRSLEKS